jgi:parallel beta-helix repeat protein
MEKNIFLLLFCGLIAVLVVGIDTGVASAKTWHVDDDFADYPAANFSSIQDAIDAADPRDIIFVYNGTYEYLIVNKSLRLISKSIDSVIDGAWYRDCVKITSPDVSIDGFTIKGSAEDASAIIVMANNSAIVNNTISESGYGIYVKSSNNTIRDNNVTSNSINDIYLGDGFNTIVNNFIGYILIHSGNNNIANNAIKKKFVLERATCHNEIADNIREVGIDLKKSNHNRIVNNTLDYISLSDSDYNKIENNNVKGGIDLKGPGSNYNKIINTTTKYISLKGSSNNNVINNTISQSNGDGILTGHVRTCIRWGPLIFENSLMVPSRDCVEWIYYYSTNNEITGNFINSSGGNGIYLSAKSKNTRIANNTIHSNKGIGIYVYKSSDVEITSNTIDFNQKHGIFLSESADSRITNNTINSNNGTGIKLKSSSNIIMANNDLSGNRYNFDVSGNELSHYVHSIDTSNNIEGKTICYLVSERDMKVPEDAGYVGIVNSSNITVKDLKVGKNGQGILLAYSSGENQIVNNTIKDNEYGIYLYSGSSFNRIYHNNFINNIRNAEENKSVNYFDNGPIIGGNYWSDHKCKENPSNGTQPYIIPVHNNEDKYPFENQNGWL